MLESQRQIRDIITRFGPAAEAQWGVALTPELLEQIREQRSGTFGVRTYQRNKNWNELSMLDVDQALREGRDPTSDWQYTHNLVTNEGLAHVLSVLLISGTQITTWYVTLSSSNTAESNTMTAATPGFTEITTTDVTESVRDTWTGGSVTGTTTASVDNSGSVAVYTCNTTGYTAYAAALIGGGTSAFGDTTGTLYSYSLFASSKTMSSTDTIDITYSFTATSA